MEILQLILKNNFTVKHKITVYSHDKVYDSYTSRNIEGIFIFKNGKVIVCFPDCDNQEIFTKLTNYLLFDIENFKKLEIMVEGRVFTTFEEYKKFKMELKM